MKLKNLIYKSNPRVLENPVFLAEMGKPKFLPVSVIQLMDF